MRRFLGIASAVLLVLAALPALAGGGKCTYATQECLDHMATKMKTGGWLGVELDIDEKTHVHTVKAVVDGSPAQAAGIQPGDVLQALNGVVIASATDEDLKTARGEWKVGQQVDYTIQRQGADRNVAITLGSWPADQLAKMIGKHMLEHAAVQVSAK